MRAREQASHRDAAPSAEGPRTPAPPGEARIDHRLCITEGELKAEAKGAFSCKAAKMRAVLDGSGGEHARLAFQYMGPTAEMHALGSGLERRQLGLKLKAQDPCNLLYVMWRIVPEPKIVVSFKSNPGANTSRECGNRGYTNLRPARSAPPPELTPGAEHELRADVTGSELRVTIDSQPVWQGSLPAEVLALRGAAGVRSDNVEWRIARFEAESSEHMVAHGCPRSSEGE